MRDFSALLVLAALMVNLSVSKGLAESENESVIIDTTGYALYRLEEGYALHYEKNKELPIPTQWLAPSEYRVEDEQGFVSSVNYDRQVTAFVIGSGLVGIHLSSYDIQKEGSAQAAAGRDIFLVFDSTERQLRSLGLSLGITKERLRFMGCFSAKSHRFEIGDINHDGFIDIGATKEEILCSEGYPYYKKDGILWYIFETDRWHYREAFDGCGPPSGGRRLPLIGQEKSPIDFVRELYRERLQ